MDPFDPQPEPTVPPQERPQQPEIALSPNISNAGLPPAKPLPRGYTVVAWIVIVLMCLATMAIHALDLGDEPDKGKQSADNPIDAMLFELQAKYLVSAAQWYGDDTMLYQSIEKTMGVGSITQRLKFSVLVNELMGPEVALSKLDELDELIQSEMERQNRDEPLMTLDQARVQSALRRLYTELAARQGDAPPAALSEDDRQRLREMGIEVGDAIEADPAADHALLVSELGWFGKLALTHLHPDDKAIRNEVLAPAQVLFWFIITVFALGALAGLCGFVALVVVAVFALLRKLRFALIVPGQHHGVYAETFAVWMVLFLALQFGAAALAEFVPRMALPITFVAFVSSLVALMWPVLRGVPWAQVRRDIGWHGGRSAAGELAIGAGSYFMALPLLAIGVAITYALFMVQEALRAPGPMFQPPASPSHPIIEQLSGPDWFPKVMVVALGAIAAPIVEETMFRGVLHGHIRGATRHWGVIASVLFSTVVNSFIFAAIHPQGWVAIPALMSLAIAFSLAREWRGSILPSMVMHGMSNFLVLTMLITALTLSRSG